MAGFPPKSVKKPPADSFAAAQEVRVREDHAIFREVMQRLSYFDFDHMPVAEFQAFAYLGVLDLWSDYDEAKKALKVKREQWEIAAMRKAPEYSEVTHNLRELFDELKEPKTLAEHMANPRLQDRVARETIRIGLHGSDLTERNRALREMMDRQMPKEMIVQQKGQILIAKVDLDRLEIVEREVKQIEAAKAPKRVKPPAGE